MRFYFVPLILFFSEIFANSPNDITSENIVASVRGRCSRKGYAKQLEDAERNIELCITHLPDAPRDEETHFRMICNVHRLIIHACVADFFKTFQMCLEPDETYFTSFVLNSFDNIVTQLCNDNSSRFKELFQIIDDDECMRNVTSSSHEAPIQKTCVSMLSFLVNLNQPGLVLTKDYVCNDLLDTAQCVVKAINNKCGNTSTTATSVTRFSNMFLDSCTTKM